MKKSNRTPPKKIKDLLRREVNFGCPVRFNENEGCGSPILTFHHFDPVWAGNYIHNPEGMIALCPEHHKQADSGMWTKKQLREMKKQPFVDDSIKIRWPWTPENIVIKFGKNLILQSGSPIRFYGKPIFEFTYERIPDLNAGQICFSSYIYDNNRIRWLKINKNIFDIEISRTENLVFKPQTRSIFAEHIDSTYIELNYTYYDYVDFIKYANNFLEKSNAINTIKNSLEITNSIDTDGRVNLVEINGSFKTPNIEIKIEKGELKYISHIGEHIEKGEIQGWIASKTNYISITDENNNEYIRFG